jgi:hypothetical protein
MTLVGSHNVRDDLYKKLVDDFPDQLPVQRNENADNLREKDLKTPTDRAVTTEPKTIANFYELFSKVVETAETEDGSAYNLIFVEEYPPVDEDLPCLSAKLLSRSPWQDVKGRRELKPRPMHTIPDPEHPGNMMEVYFHRHQNEVEISVWAKTNKAANSISDWVEDYEYQWVFEWGGFSQPIFYIGRGEDKTKEIRGQLVHQRPLRFFVITGRITKKREASIRRITLQLGIDTSEGSD